MSSIDPRLTALSAGPGAGKTTKIIRDSYGWPVRSAVVAYTRDAAEELRSRQVKLDGKTYRLQCEAATVHSLCWPHAREVSGLKAAMGGRVTQVYKQRRMANTGDAAFKDWIRTAPGKFPRNKIWEDLLAWTPEQGPAPEWIWGDKLPPTSGYNVSLARWLDKGAPLTSTPLDFLAIDEAQDVSALELAAALALVGPEGKILAVGDPGQAIFHEFKGGRSKDLPTAWRIAGEKVLLHQGFRCGEPLASSAAAVLRPYYDLPAEAFAAVDPTTITTWRGCRPNSGMVLGNSRQTVATQAKKWGLRDFPVTPAARSGEAWELSLSTVHAAKGCEADDVYLIPWSRDAMSRLRAKEPAALKLLYVSMTRAKKRLHMPIELQAEIPRY